MNKLGTTSVSLAVTPTVVSTFFSHYLNKKSLKEKPTAHLSYDEGLSLVRSFLEHASHHRVEDLQAFTAQWVPSPRWIKVEAVTIDEEYLKRSAETIQQELGEDGIALVGGRKWWQWRRPDTTLEAEWIEMRAHARERKKSGNQGHRVMLYLHGGGYYFGSVDEHRYQMQRHARKLKARVFAPRYRLAPQFPFPCGIQDCLAAYLYLLSSHDPSSIIIAGDSAGGGMTLAILCILRNQGLPLPAGSILISPWVDLTHSFPSVALDTPFDYIPKAGFHHKPSKAWPPPNDDDIAQLRAEAEQVKNKNGKSKTDDKDLKNAAHWPADANEYLHVTIDGESVTVKDQIQMYTTNSLLKHPLVSPVWQASLGGLPPMLIMVGGGELLRDEQIYLAHKCANPGKYPLPPEMMTERNKEQTMKYKPTDVQLQVWDDMCHVGPTLSFTRPAKFMYRSIAQFGAWLLARAQHRGIEILDDDQISVISSSTETQTADQDSPPEKKGEKQGDYGTQEGHVGKAGDPLPPFKNHMIRQRVTRHGVTLPLAPEAELPGCCMEPSDLGVVKQGTAKKWLAMREVYNERYAHAKAKVHRKMVRDFATGFAGFGDDEIPPPTALAGRRTIDSYLADGVKRKKSLGLALWSLWGSKHDEATLEREEKANDEPDAKEVTGDEGRGAQPAPNGQASGDAGSRSRSRRRTVVDEHQTDDEGGVNEDTPVGQLLNQRKEQEAEHPGLLSPNYVPETGVAGKRPFIKGLALPFSLDKDADTASMMTLNSSVTPMEANKQLAVPTSAAADSKGAAKPQS